MRLIVLILGISLIGATSEKSDTAKIGTIKLCRPTVVSASVGSDQDTGVPIVIIQFDKQTTATFAALTRRSKGRRLNVTLNGRIIGQPWVEVPILMGHFNVSGPDKRMLDRVVQAAAADC